MQGGQNNNGNNQQIPNQTQFTPQNFSTQQFAPYQQPNIFVGGQAGGYGGQYQPSQTNLKEAIDTLDSIKARSDKETQEKIGQSIRQIILTGKESPEERDWIQKKNALFLTYLKTEVIDGKVISSINPDLATKIEALDTEYEALKLKKKQEKENEELRIFLEINQKELDKSLKKIHEECKEKNKGIFQDLEELSLDVKNFTFFEGINTFEDNRKIVDFLKSKKRIISNIINDIIQSKFPDEEWTKRKIKELQEIRNSIEEKTKEAKKSDSLVLQSVNNLKELIESVINNISKPSETGIIYLQDNILKNISDAEKIILRPDYEYDYFDIFINYIRDLFGFEHINDKFKDIKKNCGDLYEDYKKLKLESEDDDEESKVSDFLSKVKKVKSNIQNVLSNINYYSNDMSEDEIIVIKKILKGLKSELSKMMDKEGNLFSLFGSNIPLEKLNRVIGQDINQKSEILEFITLKTAQNKSVKVATLNCKKNIISKLLDINPNSLPQNLDFNLEIKKYKDLQNYNPVESAHYEKKLYSLKEQKQIYDRMNKIIEALEALEKDDVKDFDSKIKQIEKEVPFLKDKFSVFKEDGLNEIDKAIKNREETDPKSDIKTMDIFFNRLINLKGKFPQKKKELEKNYKNIEEELSEVLNESKKAVEIKFMKIIEVEQKEEKKESNKSEELNQLIKKYDEDGKKQKDSLLKAKEENLKEIDEEEKDFPEGGFTSYLIKIQEEVTKRRKEIELIKIEGIAENDKTKELEAQIGIYASNLRKKIQSIMNTKEQNKKVEEENKEEKKRQSSAENTLNKKDKEENEEDHSNFESIGNLNLKRDSKINKTKPEEQFKTQLTY